MSKNCFYLQVPERGLCGDRVHKDEALAVLHVEVPHGRELLCAGCVEDLEHTLLPVHFHLFPIRVLNRGVILLDEDALHKLYRLQPSVAGCVSGSARVYTCKCACRGRGRTREDVSGVQSAACRNPHRCAGRSRAVQVCHTTCSCLRCGGAATRGGQVRGRYGPVQICRHHQSPAPRACIPSSVARGEHKGGKEG